MLIVKPRIFEKYPEITFGFNTKLGNEREAPYYFNMSFSVGDNPEIVKENRELFFNALELDIDSVAFQKQVHGCGITYVKDPGNCGESDAMITGVPGLGLAVSTADCAAIFIYDKKNKIISGIHSGWRGTQKKIVEKTLLKLSGEYGSRPDDLIAYIAPSICQENYEIGEEVADIFEGKYLKPDGKKFLLDVAGANYDMLLNYGLKKENVQKSKLCTYELKEIFHSYRRDGLHSGRAYGIIALKNM